MGAVGLRNADVVEAARTEALVDLFVLIRREILADPTTTFGPMRCDIVMSNNGMLNVPHVRSRALARFVGLLTTVDAKAHHSAA